jgi:hypothetical protein
MTISQIEELIYGSSLKAEDQVVVVVSNMTAISLLSEAKKEMHYPSDPEDKEFRIFGVPIKTLDISPLQFEGALLMSQKQYKELTAAQWLYNQYKINDANF